MNIYFDLSKPFVLAIFFVSCVGLLSSCSKPKSTVQDPEVQIQRIVAEGTPFSLALSPDLQSFATGGFDGSASIWKLNGSKVKTFGGGSRSSVYSVAISPDGQRIAGGVENSVKIWDVQSGKEVLSLQCPAQVYEVAFSPDGKIVASSGEDKTIKLWDAASGTEIRTFKDMGFPWAFSADGKLLASATQDKNIKIWQVSDGSELATLQPAVKDLGRVKFSPDSKMLALSGGNTIHVWDIKQKKQLPVLESNDVLVQVAFSPDGKLLAASSSKVVKMWDVGTGKEVRQFPSKSVKMDSLAFDVSGKTLVALGWDKTVERWDVQTGDPIKES